MDSVAVVLESPHSTCAGGGRINYDGLLNPPLMTPEEVPACCPTAAYGATRLDWQTRPLSVYRKRRRRPPEPHRAATRRRGEGRGGRAGSRAGRCVPLITLLFMAKFILPLMVAQQGDVSLLGVKLLEMNDVVRAMAAITIFSSAYLAEIIRGGLQAVPRGQVEAAQALGLGATRILAFIVLPQALRAVIPAIVGQLIALFKDTSLVLIVGLTELLSVARQVTAQADFIGTQAEALLFIALVYWIVAFSMSRASQQLERTLGVGER